MSEAPEQEHILELHSAARYLLRVYITGNENLSPTHFLVDLILEHLDLLLQCLDALFVNFFPRCQSRFHLLQALFLPAILSIPLFAAFLQQFLCMEIKLLAIDRSKRHAVLHVLQSVKLDKMMPHIYGHIRTWMRSPWT